MLEMNVTPQACCPICLDVLSVKPIGATSPCGHIFHRECFGNWITSVNNRSRSSSPVSVKCPTCNQKSKHFLNLFLDFDKLHMKCNDSDSNESTDEETENFRPNTEKYVLLRTKYRNCKRENVILKDMVTKSQDCAVKLKEMEEKVSTAVEAEKSARSALQDALYAKEKNDRLVAMMRESIRDLENENKIYKENQKHLEQNIHEIENKKLKEIQDARANRLSEVKLILQRNSELAAKTRTLETRTAVLEQQLKLQQGKVSNVPTTYKAPNIAESKAILKETVSKIDRINVQVQEDRNILKRKIEHKQMMSKLSSRASNILATATKKQKRTVRPTFSIPSKETASVRSDSQVLNTTTFTERRPLHMSSLKKPTTSGGTSIKRFFN